MNATETFISDAIKGGWRQSELPEWNAESESVSLHGSSDEVFLFVPEILLDPLAWQAVGKTRGYRKTHLEDKEGNYDECWRCQMHCFIDLLIQGESLEEALTQLT
jgi:hypothetical protein